MAIKKQEFYEGAALHSLARTGAITSIHYDAPFFCVNNRFLVLLKYSTKGRSPWAFTFTPEEQSLLEAKAAELAMIIGLICGSDGIATLTYTEYLLMAKPRETAIHIACYRDYGEHYEVNGPDGALCSKISPSNWRRILEQQ